MKSVLYYFVKSFSSFLVGDINKTEVSSQEWMSFYSHFSHDIYCVLLSEPDNAKHSIPASPPQRP